MDDNIPPQPFASSRCPDPFPKKRPEPPPGNDNTNVHPKRSPRETISFDGVSTRSLHRVLPGIFIGVNPHPETSGWQWPSLNTLLVELWYAIYIHHTKKKGAYGDAMARFGLELVVAVVDDLDEGALHEVRARDKCRYTLFGRWKGKAYALRPLFSLAPFPEVLVPDFRMDIVRSKISTPGGNWVHGPYLAVMLVEKSTGLAVRARFFPLWFDLGLDRFAITRSKPECYLAKAISDLGGVAFSPTIHAQLGDLQKAFGHIWGGDISRYPYLPDPILMPVIGRMPTLTEFLGMARLRHYAESIGPKLRAGAKGKEEGLFNFQSLIGERGSEAKVAKQISNWAPTLFADPSNGLFQAMPPSA